MFIIIRNSIGDFLFNLFSFAVLVRVVLVRILFYLLAKINVYSFRDLALVN